MNLWKVQFEFVKSSIWICAKFNLDLWKVQFGFVKNSIWISEEKSPVSCRLWTARHDSLGISTWPDWRPQYDTRVSKRKLIGFESKIFHSPQLWFGKCQYWEQVKKGCLEWPDSAIYWAPFSQLSFHKSQKCKMW